MHGPACEFWANLTPFSRELPAAQAAELGLCFDPTNTLGLSLASDCYDCYDELAALPPDMLMIAHFKQSVVRPL
jgi:hypothetical protein